MSRSLKMLISNWSRTRKFNRLLHLHAGKAIALGSTWCKTAQNVPGHRLPLLVTTHGFWLFSLSCVDHALRPIFMFWLVKNWQVSLCGKFLQRLETCFTDSWSWESFVSSCDVLNCLFLLGLQNEIQLLSRLFGTCNSWLVCLLRFLLTNAPLVKVIGNPISDGIVFKNELTHLPLLEA